MDLRDVVREVEALVLSAGHRGGSEGAVPITFDAAGHVTTATVQRWAERRRLR